MLFKHLYVIYNYVVGCGLYGIYCGTGECVPSYYECDDFDDCGNNHDEQGCGMYTAHFNSFHTTCTVEVEFVYIKPYT